MTAENEGISSSSSLSYMSHQLKYLHYIWTEQACSLVNFGPACSLANQRVKLSILNQCVLSLIDTFLKTSDQRIEQITTHLIAQRIVLERQCYVIKTTRQYCLIAAFNTFIIWLITITSQQLNAGFFSLADIAFQGSFNVKYSVVIIIIIVIIIFLHHHVRESLSCADETFLARGC